jgi:hypothetical protein
VRVTGPEGRVPGGGGKCPAYAAGGDSSRVASGYTAGAVSCGGQAHSIWSRLEYSPKTCFILTGLSEFLPPL